ncbi:LytTR family DNA-binding domain-containing protein [Paenibacillus sp. S150]|uniref:LytR/AlgR family response regulator transcription factor n=1 Tax=Paenibacillus sp. S150 TaxID=2749826 RepID=UPI001C594C0D|nr:response regulator [Paenibacillus sp. S150]MBW4085818.1 response regulator [Paenibacillus sp. S150]
MIKAFLLDVNQRDLYKLSYMLQHSGKVNVIGMSAQPQEAVDKIILLQPDVLFMDLQLPGLQGIFVAELVKQKVPHIQIVVVTESKQHALWAFDQAVADYVLKPLEEVRLSQSLERLRKGS